jgi:hypothetical protein
MSKAAERKATPVFSGFIKYFPLAIQEVARCSLVANEQHNPGTPVHWDRAKSGDELDALARHLVDAGTVDDDGIRHSAKVAWRALANLEKELERANESSKQEPAKAKTMLCPPSNRRVYRSVHGVVMG